MLSVSTFLSKIASRLVLAAYLTQIFAPIAHAMETETLRSAEDFYPTPKPSFQTRGSCRQATIGPEPHPDPVGQAFEWQDFKEADYASLYQYYVAIQAVGESGHTLSLSRKIRDPLGKLMPQFEDLYTATIEHGQFKNFWEQDDASLDPMLAAFRQARPQTLEAEDRLMAYSWTILGFGNIKVGINGTVIFDQYGNPPAFSPYDLILKTSSELYIQSLNVAGLTLQSPKTSFNGAASIGRLRLGSNAKVINNCGMGKHPGLLRINDQVINSGSIVNKGVLQANKITGSGKLLNWGNDAAMTVDLLQTSGEVINEGVLDAKLIINSGMLRNRGIGRILGAYHLQSDGEVINDAILHACKVTGSGKLTNQGILKMVGTKDKSATLGIREVLNRKRIEGINVRLTSENQVFENAKGAEADIGVLIVDPVAQGASGASRGSMVVKEGTINRIAVNSSWFQASKLAFKGKNFTNERFATLRILEEFSCPSAALVNEGEIDSRGSFTKEQGQFTNSGKWTHDGKHKGKVHLGKTALANAHEGEITWKNSEWATAPEAITCHNDGKWILKSMTGTVNVALENRGSFECLENSNIGLSSIHNEEKGAISISPDSVLSATSSLIDGGSIDNKGTFLGETLRIADSKTLTNDGVMKVARIAGAGKFQNRQELQLVGTANKTAQVDVACFENGDASALTKDKSAKVIGSHVTFGYLNKEAVNHKNGTIESIGKFIKKTGTLTNQGIWNHTGDIDLNMATLTNTATGKILWKDGAVTADAQGVIYRNEGIWGMNAIRGSVNVALENIGELHLKGAKIGVRNLKNFTDCEVFLSDDSELTVAASSANKGSFEGGTLTILDKGAFTNDGAMNVNGIAGAGKFQNRRKLLLLGTQTNPAQVNVQHFENGEAKEPHPSTTAEVSGSHITFGSTNKTLENHKNGKIESRKTFSKKSGTLTNHGAWNHIGNLDLGSTDITNAATGKIVWQNGAWATSPRGTTSLNQGAWDLNAIKGATKIVLKNDGLLCLAENTDIRIERFDNGTSGKIALFPASGIEKLDDQIVQGNTESALVSGSSRLRFMDASNKGLLQAEILKVAQGKTVVNDGAVPVKELDGLGTFLNRNDLGAACKPLQISIQNLKNGCSEEEAKKLAAQRKVEEEKNPSAKDGFSRLGEDILSGMYSSIAERFRTHGFYLAELRKLEESTRRIHAEVDRILAEFKRNMAEYYRRVRGSGRLAPETSKSPQHVAPVENKREKAVGRVYGSITVTPENKTFINHQSGWIQSTSFSKKTGTFTNQGIWDTTGNLDLGKMEIANTGTWVLENVKTNHPLNVKNDGVLHLKKGTVAFATLHNQKNLILSDGSYTVDDFKNEGLLSFLDHSWTVSNNSSHRKKSRHFVVTRYRDEGTTESEKTLTIDQPTVPNNMRLMQGQKLAFTSPRTLDEIAELGGLELVSEWSLPHNILMKKGKIYVERASIYRSGVHKIKYKVKSPARDVASKDGFIEDTVDLHISEDYCSASNFDEILEEYGSHILKKIFEKGHIRSAVPRLSMTCDGFSVRRDYLFANINILDLVVNGDLNIYEKLKAGAISLLIHGKLTFGRSNDTMGTLVATDGPLTVTAHAIDGRFVKIYGKGATKLKATKGDLICGASIEKPCDREKKLGCAHSYTTVVGDRWAYSSVSDVNGASIASGSNLDLEGSSLILSYSQIFSRLAATFKADNKIEAIRSIIQGNGTADWKAKSIHFGRANAVQVCFGWMSSYYTCVYGWAVKSDQTEVHFGNSIWFDTPELKVTGSTITSRNSIYIRYNHQYLKLDSKDKSLPSPPRSVKMESCGWTGWGQTINFASKILSNERIEIDGSDLVLNGMMNSSLINIQATGNALFHNTSRSRTTISAPVLLNVTVYIQKQASPNNAFLQLMKNGEVKTLSCLGESAVFPVDQIPLLVEASVPQTRKTSLAANSRQTINFPRKANHQYHPNTPDRIMNPLKSLPLDMLDLFLQRASAEYGGTLAMWRGHKSPFKAACQDSSKWIQKNGRDTITQQEIIESTQAMLICQAQDVGDRIQLDFLYSIPANVINSYQSEGDASCDEFYCKTGGNQTHRGNRIISRGLIETDAGGDTNRETTKYATVHKSGDTTIYEEHAGPEQIWQARNIRSKGQGSYTCIGTNTEAVEDITEQFSGDINEQNLTLNKTVITESEDKGFLSSQTTTETHSTHTHRPNKKKAGRHIISESGQESNCTGFQHEAGKSITYIAKKLNHSSSIARDVHTTTKESNSFGSSSKSYSMQQTPSIAYSSVNSPLIYLLADHIVSKGVTYYAKQIIDGSIDGGTFESAIVEMLSESSVEGNSPLSSFNCGRKAGQEVEVKTRIVAEQLIHLPEGQVLMEDDTKRRVKTIFGDDSASGFASLLMHLPGFDPLKAREVGVNFLLKALNNPTLQPQVCKLIAPEIREGGLNGRFSALNEVQGLIQKTVEAQEQMKVAVTQFQEAVGKKATKGLAIDELLAIGGHPVPLEKLKNAIFNLSMVEAEKTTWSQRSETVREFIQTFVAKPDWELGYASEHEVGISSGVMDALALAAGVNLKIYQDASENVQRKKGTFVFEKEKGMLKLHKFRQNYPIYDAKELNRIKKAVVCENIPDENMIQVGRFLLNRDANGQVHQTISEKIVPFLKDAKGQVYACDPSQNSIFQLLAHCKVSFVGKLGGKQIQFWTTGKTIEIEGKTWPLAQIQQPEEPELVAWSLIHKQIFSPDAPTVELIHRRNAQNLRFNLPALSKKKAMTDVCSNSFDRLELIDPTTDTAKSTFTNAEVNIGQFIGNYEHTVRELKHWEQTWAEHSQVFPSEALIVVSLALTIATQGMGASLLQGSLTSLFGTTTVTTTVAGIATTAIVPTISLTATGMAMASAGLTTLINTAAMSFLSTGDITKTSKNLFSKDSFKSLAMSVATAGLGTQVGSSLGVNMAPGQTAFTGNLQKFGVLNGSSLVVNSIVGEKLDSGAVLKAVGNTVIDAGTATAASNLGMLSKNAVGDNISHKVAHFGAGFGAGVASATINGGDVLMTGLSSGIGAMGSEMIAEGLTQEGETNPKVIERNANISRILTTGLGAVIGLDPYAALRGADNALSNNFTPSHGRKAAKEDDDEEKEARRKSKEKVEDAQEDRGRGRTRDKGGRPFINPETYNPIEAAHTCTKEEFVADLMAYDKHLRGRSLSPNSKIRAGEAYAIRYVNLQQFNHHQEFVNPGLERFGQRASMSLGDFQQQRLAEIDPHGVLPEAKRLKVEKAIASEYTLIKAQNIGIQIGIIASMAGGVKGGMPKTGGAKGGSGQGKVTGNQNLAGLDLANANPVNSFLQQLKGEAPKRITLQGIPNAGGTITSFVTTQEEVYYRVYSGNKTSGRFLTKVPPKSNLFAQEGLSLPPSNTAEFLQEVVVPSGIRLQRSRALPVPEWGKSRGGLEQFQILEKDLTKVMFKNGDPFK